MSDSLYNVFAPRCLHPKRIYNKYTHEPVVVSCGKCEACQLRKAGRYMSLIDEEVKFYKYVMFVTLTYSNEYIPKYNGVSILSKYDVQCFIKRLRINLRRNEKIQSTIHYFAVGEYGPTTKRPHYHLVFTFDDFAIFNVFVKVLHKSWKLGFVSWSRVDQRQSVSNYVSQYCNSVSIVGENVERTMFPPFRLHSQNYGSPQVKELAERILEDVRRGNISQVYRYRNSDVRLSECHQIVATLFPRCPSFGRLSFQEKLGAYHFAKRCIDYFNFPESLPFTFLAVRVKDEFDFLWSDNESFVNYEADEFIWFRVLCRYRYLGCLINEDFIYHLLLFSRKYLRTTMMFYSVPKSDYVLPLIQKFYDLVALDKLYNQYAYFEFNCFDMSLYDHFYNNTFNRYEVMNSYDFKNFRFAVGLKWLKSQKRKKMYNNINNI